MSLQTSQSSEVHFSIFVDYNMPKDRETLESEFSKDNVDDVFCETRHWGMDDSCRKVEKTPKEITLILAPYEGFRSLKDSFQSLMNVGRRPATHLELYGFAKANPKIQALKPIFALGSYTVDGCALLNAYLSKGWGNRRALRAAWLGNGLDIEHWLLCTPLL